MEKPKVRISVRNLVEFILRSGDLDNSRGSSGDKEAMLKGGRLHRKIQRSMKGNYQAEVSLKRESEYEDVIIQVEGRADGIFTEDGEFWIDEIKGTYGNLQAMEVPVPVHRAQAMCYGWIYGEKEGLSQIGIQMTYSHLDTEDTRRFREIFSMEELKNWYQKLLDDYHKWISCSLSWKKERNASMKDLQFPFPYREGQREIVSGVYHTVSSKKTLFVQAPTGVGKTMSAIFPSVRAIGEGKGETLFYLTAKTITGTVAWEAFHTLRENGLKFKVTAITAKEKLCFLDSPECTPEKCPYAKGHFDRVNDAVYELLTSSDELNREILEEQARKWKVCPYEMSLDVAVWVDAIICDYNYVFDPQAHLRRFFGEGNKGDYLFLIDEAHNLVERGRQMYSASICKEDFLGIKKKVRYEDEKLTERLEDCNRGLLAMKRECEEYKVLNSVSHIYLKLLNLVTELERFLEECEKEDIREEVLEFYFHIRSFMDIHERLDENYVIYSELDGEGKFRVHLFCVNPAGNLGEFLQKGNSTIFFSATLLPITYYKKLLSTGKEDYAIYAESPFDVEHRLLMVGGDVSTKYTRRNEEMYQRYARYLWKLANGKKGNYLVFFPSYRFLEDVYEAFEKIQEKEELEAFPALGHRITCVTQSQSMSEKGREEFLNTFEEERKESLLGFCVMGGIFSEGIDLTEDKLIGAVIVGTGLPQVCREREILKDYFDQHGQRGFDYAYLYPGMNKVLQAAGRVIRTDEDRGVILLLDDRFFDRRYQDTFPREWENQRSCSLGNMAEQIEEFWKKEKEEAQTVRRKE